MSGASSRSGLATVAKPLTSPFDRTCAGDSTEGGRPAPAKAGRPQHRNLRAAGTACELPGHAGGEVNRAAAVLSQEEDDLHDGRRAQGAGSSSRRAGRGRSGRPRWRPGTWPRRSPARSSAESATARWTVATSPDGLSRPSRTPPPRPRHHPLIEQAGGVGKGGDGLTQEILEVFLASPDLALQLGGAAAPQVGMGATVRADTDTRAVHLPQLGRVMYPGAPSRRLGT